MLRAKLLLRAQEELEVGEATRSSQELEPDQEPEPELELKLFLLKEQQPKKSKR